MAADIIGIRASDYDTLEVLTLALDALKHGKPNDRSEKDRLYAIAITEQQKVIGFFNTWILSDGRFPVDAVHAVPSAGTDGQERINLGTNTIS